MPKKQKAEALFEPTPECPSIEELVKLSERRSDVGQSVAMQEHVAGCPRCQSELALLTSFQEAEATPEEEEDLQWVMGRLPGGSAPQRAEKSILPSTSLWAALRSSWSRLGLFRPVPVLAAIAALVIVGIGIREFTATAPDLRLPGESAGSGTFRGSQMRLLTPLTEIASLPSEIKWEPVAGAATYQVIIRFVDGAEAVRFTVASNRAKWPESVRALATPSRSLFVEVVALDSGGKKLATSEKQLLKLRGN